MASGWPGVIESGRVRALSEEEGHLCGRRPAIEGLRTGFP